MSASAKLEPVRDEQPVRPIWQGHRSQLSGSNPRNGWRFSSYRKATKQENVTVHVLIARWLSPISCAALVLIAACDSRIDLARETDAELFCRQGGFDLKSTAYEDCVEASSKLALRPPGDDETGTASLVREQAEPSAAGSETSTTALPAVSESPEPSDQATAIKRAEPAQPLFAAHLSSVRNQTGTETEWKRLQKDFPGLLGAREPMVRFVQLEGQGAYFRVLTGPFTDYAKADGFCAAFKSRGRYCLAMRLRGDQPLTAIRPELSDQPLFAVHLSSVRAEVETQTEWKRLQKHFPNLLEERELVVQPIELEGQGKFFRVLTGPFASYMEAEGFCAAFESRGQYCLTTRLKKDQSHLLSISG